MKIASDVLRAETFETYADLFDAVKTAVSRLHVPYDGPAINQALRELAMRRGGVLTTSRRPAQAPTPVAPPTVGHSEAAAILADLRERFAKGVRSWA